MEDNTATEHVVNTGKGRKRARHIEVKFHYARELVEAGRIKVVHCPTDDQGADILTKSGIPVRDFEGKRAILGMAFVPKQHNDEPSDVGN